jgi:hypothetical protein
LSFLLVWKAYKKTGHGGDVELKKLSFDYMKSNFKYSILDIFKSTTDDKTIIARESWWKEVLILIKKGAPLVMLSKLFIR